MKNIIIIAVIFGITLTQSAFSGGDEGENCSMVSQGNDCSPDINQNKSDLALICVNTTVKCYKNPQGKKVGIYSCKQCSSSNAKLTTATTTISGCNKTVSYNTCTACSSCTGCTSDSNFVSASTTGYEKKTTATCNCGNCTKTTQYRCAAGYYGSSTNGSTGCNKCPSSGGVAGQSVAGSNSAITSCYIPAGSSLSDGTGSYTYTSNCYYSN